MKNKFTKSTLFVSLIFPALIGCSNAIASTDYNVRVVSILDKPLANVKAEVLDKNSNVVFEAKTNSNGYFVVPKETNGDKVIISDLPLGHYQDSPATYKAENFTIKIPTQVIEANTPSNTRYKINDIMYDFAITDTDGVTYTLAETLKEKELVILNFWATYCSPCKREFPILNEVYNERKDEIELFAMSFFDTNSSIINFKNGLSSPLNFPMASVDHSLFEYFNINDIPFTVVVNKYGIIQHFSQGSFASKAEVNNVIDLCLKQDYGISIENSDDGNGELEKPNYDDLSSSEYAAVASGTDFIANYYGDDAEYNWPWIISKDKTSIQPGNAFKPSSYSIIYATFNIGADEVFAFDYEAHTEYNDVLYVFVDGRVQHEIYGRDASFSTYYCFSTIANSEHTIAFAYLKNSTSDDDIDTVYIKNLRKVKINDITDNVYVETYACDNLDLEANRYQNHVNAVYNSVDGYYHVDSVNGPILYADLLNNTAFSNMSLFEISGFGDPLNLLPEYQAILKHDVEVIAQYAAIQNNSKNYKVPVRKDLRLSMNTFCALIAGFNHADLWLELCSYYKEINMGSYPDPIKGLATFSAYEGHLGENSVNIDRLIMPKGLYTSFTPESSGIYHIYSVTVDAVNKPETMCWLYDENDNYLTETDFGERYYMTCEEPDENFSLYYYLEEGHTYYFRVAFQILDYMGDIPFFIENTGLETYEILTIASPAYFTTGLDEHGNMTNEIIAGGYDVSLESDGFYHAVLEDGTVGGILHADFKYNTGLGLSIGSHFLSILDMINEGMFNFVRDTSGTPCSLGENKVSVNLDGTQYTYENTTSETIGLIIYSDDPNALIVYGSGNQAQLYYGGTAKNGFMVNVKPGQIASFKVSTADLISENIDVTFSVETCAPTLDAEDLFDGVDRTLEMKVYTLKMIKGGELDGLVPVDEKLATMLQEFMDKYTIVCDHSWTKLCYFYKEIKK